MKMDGKAEEGDVDEDKVEEDEVEEESGGKSWGQIETNNGRRTKNQVLCIEKVLFTLVKNIFSIDMVGS